MLPSPILEDAQRLEVLRGKLLELHNFLGMNQYVINSMKTGFEKFRRLSAENSAKYAEDAEFVEFAASLDDHLMRTSQHRKRVKTLIRKCESLATLVSFPSHKVSPNKN